MKKIITIIAVAGIFFALAFNIFQKISSQDMRKEKDSLQVIIPEAVSFSPKTPSPLHYKAYNKLDPAVKPQDDKEVVGAAAVTTDLAPEIRGYSGKIKTIVGLNPQGKITGIQVIKHSETPSYVYTLDNFLKQFIHKNINDDFIIGKDLDAITRATITSEAIARSVKKTIRIIGKEVFNLDVPTKEPNQSYNLQLDQILLILGIFLLGIIGFYKHNTFLKYGVLAASLVYFGFLKNIFVSSIYFMNILLWKLPVLQANIQWYLLISLIFLTSIFIGRFYCSSICPFGALQEFLKKLTPIKITPFEKIEYWARHIKYIILWLLIISTLIVNSSAPANIEPFITLFLRKGTTTAWILVFIVLIMSLFNYRFWCKYFCPSGVIMHYLSQMRKYIFNRH